MTPTVLYLIRHGETEFNVKGIIMGQADSPLTAKGIQQAQSLTERLRDVEFDACYTSDLPRASTTAEIVCSMRKIPLYEVESLRERNWGKFSGIPYEQFAKEYEEKIESEKQLNEKELWDFKVHADIESNSELNKRFEQCLTDIGKSNQGKTLLVVTHGGCLRTFLAHQGYLRMKDMPVGSFANDGYIKVSTDGLGFTIQEVTGV